MNISSMANNSTLDHMISRTDKSQLLAIDEVVAGVDLCRKLVLADQGKVAQVFLCYVLNHDHTLRSHSPHMGYNTL